LQTTATQVMSSLGRTVCERDHTLDDVLHDPARRLVAHLENDLLELCVTELSRLRVFGLGHAAGVEKQHVVRRKRDRSRLVVDVAANSQRRTASAQAFALCMQERLDQFCHGGQHLSFHADESGALSATPETNFKEPSI
jgi:hypothetical protein